MQVAAARSRNRHRRRHDLGFRSARHTGHRHGAKRTKHTCSFKAALRDRCENPDVWTDPQLPLYASHVCGRLGNGDRGVTFFAFGGAFFLSTAVAPSLLPSQGTNYRFALTRCPRGTAGTLRDTVCGMPANARRADARQCSAWAHNGGFLAN